MQIWSTNSGWF
jgi:bacillopeptidase F (M6 metalloprotease family)